MTSCSTGKGSPEQRKETVLEMFQRKRDEQRKKDYDEMMKWCHDILTGAVT